MISINGSVGGGQLLRTSLSLSALTKKSFKIVNIRSNRPAPGLKPQHLTAVNTMKEICNAEVTGNQIKSMELIFNPNKIQGGKFKIEIGTAGSTTLILQTLIPPLLTEKNKSMLELQGGTDTLWCPPSLYIKYVFLDLLKKIGISCNYEIEKFGFYPKGQGKIRFEISPCKKLKEINFTERGELQKISLQAYASEELEHKEVTTRMINSFKSNFPKDYEIIEKISHVKTASTGCFLHSHILFQNFNIGDGVLGEPHRKSEDLGKELAIKMKVLLDSKGVDHFAADQLLIFMALNGSGQILTDKITNHIKTNIMVIERFLDVKFHIKNNLIICKAS